MESLRTAPYDSIDAQFFSYTISLIEGKWKMHILFWLWKTQVMRYGQLKRSLDGVTHKMLSSQLKQLEEDGLILRTEYPQVPPKVEYRLSDLGFSLMPILQSICEWGHHHFPETSSKSPASV